MHHQGRGRTNDDNRRPNRAAFQVQVDRAFPISCHASVLGGARPALPRPLSLRSMPHPCHHPLASLQNTLSSTTAWLPASRKMALCVHAKMGYELPPRGIMTLTALKMMALRLHLTRLQSLCCLCYIERWFRLESGSASLLVRRGCIQISRTRRMSQPRP